MYLIKLIPKENKMKNKKLIIILVFLALIAASAFVVLGDNILMKPGETVVLICPASQLKTVSHQRTNLGEGHFIVEKIRCQWGKD